MWKDIKVKNQYRVCQEIYLRAQFNLFEYILNGDSVSRKELLILCCYIVFVNF